MSNESESGFKKTGEGIEKNKTFEQIESLTDSELVYQLILVFKKTFKNIDKTEPTINKILNYFISLNKKDDTPNYIEFDDILIEISWRRNREISHSGNFIETIDIYNKKFLLLILLHKLIKSLTKSIDSSPHILDYLSHLNIIYRLYLSTSDLSMEDMERLNKLYKAEELYKIADNLLAGNIK